MATRPKRVPACYNFVRKLRRPGPPFQLISMTMHSTVSYPLRYLVITAFCLWCPTVASAQNEAVPATPANETPNLIHDRHMHSHNDRLPVEAPTEGRFYTTRSSDVVLPLPTEEDAFVFAVFGDRTGGPAEGVNVLADAVRDVNLVEPDLVMTVGDLINGYNRTDEWTVQMREFKTIMNQLLCPWFPVAGNHDVYWRPLDDPNRPKMQHDENYELHFGPLWYSFRHKNCNFIVLYSDEGDPNTGEKNFSRPELQKISDEQLAFLKQALERGKDDQHQFIFLHHPRWLGAGYGEDWKLRVHPLLVETGNVTAVFAGHIHHMRYDPQDNIEYVTLATVGGGQQSTVPSAGFLHHYHLVTVRPNQVAMAAFPVGDAMNVREITGQLQQEAVALATRKINIDGALTITDEGPQNGQFTATIDNPTSRAIEFTVSPLSRDSRWVMTPNHAHGHLEPGESQRVTFAASYLSKGLDDAFDTVRLAVEQDYLAPTTRYSIPAQRHEVPLDLQLSLDATDATDLALEVDGDGDYVRIPAADVVLPQGPFTFECWFQAQSYGGRVGLLAKTQASEYGIFVSQGNLDVTTHFGGKYRGIKPDEPLETDRWYHVAGVYDGNEFVAYLNGLEIGRSKIDPSWHRTVNELPLLIGADPDGQGAATSFFRGMIDDVRVSTIARYTAPFTPTTRLTADADTVVYYNFDRQIGNMILDSGPKRSHQIVNGDAHLVPAGQ